ncbi:MAG: hypothetical protein MOGMAGMI_02322 [Candidatus Omnitrophica bacterium]|nr:hypothetical protein [Candidatus Omnitrophota bacterium]
MAHEPGSKKVDTAKLAANDKDKDGAEPFNGVKGTEKLPKAKKKNVVVTDEKATIQSKYKFTPDEMKAIAKEMAECHSEEVVALEEKKAAMSNFKDRIDRIKLRISTLSRNYRDTFEMRDYPCVVVYDYKKREKRFKRVDNGEIIERRPFSPGDDQRRFL